MITRVTDIDTLEAGVIERLGNAFFSEGGLPGSFHLEHFKAVWRMLLATEAAKVAKQPHGAMWLANHDDGRVFGAIGGILYTGMFSPAISAVETFWYVEPASRGGTAAVRLHNEFETWAALHKASTVTMVHINNLMPASLAGYYIKRGYRPFETCYIKEL